MEWAEETCLPLISEYRSKKILWSTRNSSHYNKLKKEDAWQELSRKIGKPSKELKKKIESLKGSYRREKSRSTKSMRTRKGQNKIYVSKWFAFESLQFLDDKDEPRKPISTLRTVSDQENTEVEIEMHTNVVGEGRAAEALSRINAELCNSERVDKVVENKEVKSSKKQAMRRQKHNEDARMEKAFGYLKQATAVANDKKDQCSTFGDYITEKLRSFNPCIRAIA